MLTGQDRRTKKNKVRGREQKQHQRKHGRRIDVMRANLLSGRQTKHCKGRKIDADEKKSTNSNGRRKTEKTDRHKQRKEAAEKNRRGKQRDIKSSSVLAMRRRTGQQCSLTSESCTADSEQLVQPHSTPAYNLCLSI